MIAVSGLSITPVKGTRIHEVQEIDLSGDGARGDRRFYVIDERGRMLNGKLLRAFQPVVAEYSEPTLTLFFPGGKRERGVVEQGSYGEVLVPGVVRLGDAVEELRS